MSHFTTLLTNMQKLEAKTTVSFQRRFLVWAYVTSHRQLLLRSNRSQNHASRVDILFEDVGWMSLPSWFESLEIREGGENVLCSIQVTSDSEIMHGRQIFLLDGGNRSGIVVARDVTWHEDNGSYGDPSPLAKSLFIIGGGDLT
jgi:hypothetical protein